MNGLFNVTALSIALGGHYLRPGISSAVMDGRRAAAVTALWEPLSSVAIHGGLPPLCAPFNVALIGSLLIFGLLQKRQYGG